MIEKRNISRMAILAAELGACAGLLLQRPENISVNNQPVPETPIANTEMVHPSYKLPYFSWEDRVQKYIEENTAPEPDLELESEELTREGCTLEIHRQVEGRVTFYSRAGCVGCRSDLKMANGEELSDRRRTIAAIYQFPLNSYVWIINPLTGLEIYAQVTDRGGFIEYGYLADVTPGVSRLIGGVQGQRMIIIPMECNGKQLDLSA
jgi:hypothetical protein